jgi:hypothetical protein
MYAVNDDYIHGSLLGHFQIGPTVVSGIGSWGNSVIGALVGALIGIIIGAGNPVVILIGALVGAVIATYLVSRVNPPSKTKVRRSGAGSTMGS